MQTPLDELAAVIGFNPTLAIVAWFGDSRLYVPETANDGHILRAVVGPDAFDKLVEHFGGTDIYISNCLVAERAMRDKRIYDLSKTKTSAEIATIVGLGVRRVQKILAKLKSDFGTGDFPENGLA